MRGIKNTLDRVQVFRRERAKARVVERAGPLIQGGGIPLPHLSVSGVTLGPEGVDGAGSQRLTGPENGSSTEAVVLLRNRGH